MNNIQPHKATFIFHSKIINNTEQDLTIRQNNDLNIQQNEKAQAKL